MTEATGEVAFDGVLAECLEAMEREGPTALERLCVAHPALAERLRRRLGLLAAAHLIDVGPSLDRLPSRLGDFEPLDRLGAGGMGVVHRARQVSTGRLVALKLVRPEQLLFAESRARLRREVELSARLHHPAVLDVLAVGETEGLPWFALELVHGTSLAELVAELRRVAGSTARVDGASLPELVLRLTPEPLRDGSTFEPPASWRDWALGSARQVVSALAYAHRKGVLHRDVKPSNVLLATDGRVFLTDFGLAAAPGEASMTRPSSAVGSLPYMAPEVLGGEPADAQSDVYGVGALLYELVTLRRPFEADGAPALMRAVLAGDPVRPRRHAPELGADDEAVVLRALERDPRRRYATAEELGQDLDALLAGRATRARPLGSLARLGREARRRPAAALAAVLGAAAVVAGPLGWEVSRVGALREVRGAYAAELEARERAERHASAALGAIGHVLRETASDELADVPRMQAARLSAIDRALEVVAQLEGDRPDDPAVRGERAALHAARANVLYDQGHFDEGLADCGRAESIQRALYSGGPAGSAALRETLYLHAKLLQASVRWSEALPIQRELVAAMDRAVELAPGDLAMRSELALRLADLGDSLAHVEGPAAARGELARGHALARAVRAAEPEDAEAAWAAGRLACVRGEVELDLGEHEAGRLLALEAVEAFRDAAELAPSRRSLRGEVATGLAVLGKVDALQGRAAAEGPYREALAIFADLAGEYPESVRYRLEQARVLDELAVCLRHERPDDAPPLHREALALYETLLELQPDRCQLRLAAAVAFNNWANHLVHVQRRPDDAQRACERGLALLARCRGATGEERDLRQAEARLGYLHALARCLADDVDGARPEVEGFERGAGDEAWRWRYAADLWNEWLLASRRAGGLPAELEAAARGRVVTALRRAIELGFADLDELRRTPALAALREDPDVAALLESLERRLTDGR